MITKYEEKYASQVSKLVETFPMSWGENATETVVALDEDKVVGVGSLSKRK